MLARDGDALIDLVRSGQGVLNIVPLGSVVGELDAASRARTDDAATAPACAGSARSTGLTTSRRPLPHEQVRFAHNSERQFAKLLDFYGIVWEYEPRTFTLERDRDGQPVQAFTPDFYLPAYDLFIEITTLNQKLVTKKNRKARRLRELLPRGAGEGALPARLPPPAREVRPRAAVAARASMRRRARGPLRLDLRPRDATPTLRRPTSDRPDIRPVEASTSARRMADAPAQPARRRAPRARGPHGGVRRDGRCRSSTRASLDEHRACRERRGRVRRLASRVGARCEGRGACRLLQWAFTNDLGSHRAGRAQYTHLLDPEDAHVVDDIIVWWVDDRRLHGDAERVEHRSASSTRCRERGGARDGDACTVEDVTATRAVLAVQGPQAREALRRRSRPTPRRSPRFAVAAGRVAAGAPAGSSRAPGTPARTASSCTCPGGRAPESWRALLDDRAGARRARRSRHAAARGRAPAARARARAGDHAAAGRAGLGRALRQGRLPRPDAALVAERDRGVRRRLRGLLVDGRQIPRAGCAVRVDGASVGEVTSGNFSPVLERGIALAFLPPDVADGGPRSTIDIRGRGGHRRRSCRPPFVERGRSRDREDRFVDRHIGPDAREQRTMLDALGVWRRSTSSSTGRASVRSATTRSTFLRRSTSPRRSSDCVRSPTERGDHVADRPGLLGHDHAAGHPAQRAREPRAGTRRTRRTSRRSRRVGSRRSSTSRRW